MTSLTYGTGGSCSSPPYNLGSLTYTYDADGRRTATAGSLATVALPANVAGGTSTAYNADNSQTKFNGTTHSYDTNGNLTGDGTNTYTWDARNHLTAISGGSTASFVYDGFGRRMKKVIGGTTTQFLYDGLNPVQELNSSNGVVANLLSGLRIDENFTRTDSSGNVSTFVTDALGSTVGLVGSAGSIATNYTYQPFGATTVGGSANGNSYEFTGRENDGNGLYFDRARYYSPSFQRFIAQDPIEFGGGSPNLYEYAQADPVNLNDPFGTCPQHCPPSGNARSPLFYEGLAENTIALDEYLNLLAFHRGGWLDAQASGASPAYANYVFGVYLAGAGHSLSFALGGANAYASVRSQYGQNVPMDSNYPSTPAANVESITKGFDDERNGTLCIQ